MNNAKEEPLDGNHNILLVQAQFCKMFGAFVIIKLLFWSFTIVIRDPFFTTCYNSTKEMFIQISQKQHVRKSENNEVFDS